MNTIDNKSRLILGLGQTGLSVARYLSAQGLDYKVMDSRENAPGAKQLESIKSSALIQWNGEQMLGYDQLIVSPGIAVTHPDIVRAKDFGVEIIGDIELFAQSVAVPVIAITGSNGKSTVTELVGELLKASGLTPLVGGNIGLPALDLLERMTALDDSDKVIVVLELSSFQLETTYSLQPIAATILNVSEDHLDRYADYKAYIEAKHRIFNHAETIIENSDDELTQPQNTDTKNTHATVKSFGMNADCDWYLDIAHDALVGNRQVLLKLSDLTLQGSHNALNVAAAFALVEAAGVVIDNRVIESAKTYAGMAHRSQLVAVKNGVTYINDSKATNVGATIAAINSFAPQFKQKIILIAGGDAKGANLSSLETSIKQQVKTLICFGKDGATIAELAKDRAIRVVNLQQAVEQAEVSSQAGDCVLLSPACASLDMFSNYIERGEQFEQLVEAL